MRVISYALFGHSKVWGGANFYWQCVAGIVRAHHNLFPDWELWLHHDDGDMTPLQGYAREGLIKLVPCGTVTARCAAMLWRMKPVWEPGVEYVLCRDVDSLPLPKDRRMVEAFVQSGMAAHSQSDNPSHTAHFMGGMCGFHVPQLLSLVSFKSWAEFMAASRVDLTALTGGADQQHLFNTLWNPLVARTIHHRLRWPNTSEAGGIPGTVTPLTNLHREVPNIAINDVPQHVLDHGDALTEYMGSAGFKVPETIAFYDTHGKPEVTERVRKAEAC